MRADTPALRLRQRRAVSRTSLWRSHLTAGASLSARAHDVGIYSRPRNGLSLCAGAGGLDLGLMLAEPEFHTQCWVERDEYPRQCIIGAQRAGYFRPAPIWDDITTFDGRPWRGRIDTILAGYPCQPFSMAGQRRGDKDERHLWPEVSRIIREVSPEWVFLENVAGHVTLGLDDVLRELWGLGFTPAAGLFSAAETGAPHQRQRVFVVAHRNGVGLERGEELRPRWSVDQGECRGNAERYDHAMADSDGGIPGEERVEHTPGLGCGEGRPEPEVRSGWNPPTSAGGAMANTSGARLQRREQPGSPPAWDRTPPHGSTSECGRPWVHPPGPGDLAGWRATLTARPDLAPSLALDDALIWSSHLQKTLAGPEAAAAEPTVRRMVDGLANRSRALRLLGNGVHPLAAAHAWRTLAVSHGLGPVDLGAATAA
ncbi:DNA cytosine methyltransferase [Paenirhodobacter enshiensis]|uniref:DNA cytosine methyltransferase n=1 Tax=Paenirhodobacter enshiensis TaxID=1105367 RepID=UPI0035AF6C58